MSTTAVVSTKAPDVTRNGGIKSTRYLSKAIDDKFVKSSDPKNSVQYSYVDERFLAKTYRDEIKYHKDCIKSLDENDPEYRSKVEFHTEKMHEAQKKYEELNHRNRSVGLEAFKQALKSVGEFIKDVGDKAADLILHKLLNIKSNENSIAE